MLKIELRSQLLRASRSTTANIAEGWGRFHFWSPTSFTIIQEDLYQNYWII
ncbi:four helix bundle protein [Algoriphagus halophilus]|uniref:four helix bundle protein n=1 Tax=Algoriphagus halophilus TaxID=226505 RepID=UPI00358EA284